MSDFRPKGDTDLGGTRRDFPSTCWSRLRTAGPGEARAAAEELARHYWKPVYAYVRAKWAMSIEDAKDLTQDFFAWMLEGEFLSRADPARGRFRGLVKSALNHYVIDEARRNGRLRRGGGRLILSMDGAEAIEPADPNARTPEEILDALWRESLLERAEAELERRLGAEGRTDVFLVFRDYYLAESGEPDYRELAARHGLQESDVLNHIKMAKRRYRTVIADLVAETVDDDQALDQEVRALFGGSRE